MARSKCFPCAAAAAAGRKSGTMMVILAIAIAALGLFVTLREGWSSPSLSGGRVSGSGPGQAPEGLEGPPYSERQMLLPYPNYEYSEALAPNQQFYVKNRLSNNPNNLYFYRPDLAVPSVAAGSAYRRIGIVYDHEQPDRKLPLFGRPTYPGGNRFDYYVLDDTIHTNPLPIVNHNGLELVTGNRVRIQGYPNNFHVYVYYE